MVVVEDLQKAIDEANHEEEEKAKYNEENNLVESEQLPFEKAADRMMNHTPVTEKANAGNQAKNT